MSTIKVRHELRTILNFDNESINKKKIYDLLKLTPFCLYENKDGEILCINNQISIGMYKIQIQVPNYLNESKSLKDFGRFNIKMYITSRGDFKEINILKHNILKEQPWAIKNNNKGLGLNDLTNAILLCRRLHNLRAFN